MNPRHTAALALVGWYLMTPPFASGPTGFDANAPLSRWPISQAFDTASECNADRTGVIQVSAGVARAVSDPTAQRHLKLWLASQCIATDDPRLKGK